MDVRRGEEMARQIKAAGIRKYFTVQTRTDIICKFPHLIEMWKDCGELAIFLGLESVTDEGLDAVNKSNTAANNVRALAILQGAGRRLHAQLHRRPGLGPRGLRPPARLDRGDRRLQQRLLDPDPAARAPTSGRRRSSQVTTHDWEMYDIVHAVLPTKLPLDEFYEEYSRLWRHVLDVRYRHRGKARTYVRLGAALATGKVTLGAVRKGMNIAKVFSKPETFLDAHQERPALPTALPAITTSQAPLSRTEEVDQRSSRRLDESGRSAVSNPKGKHEATTPRTPGRRHPGPPRVRPEPARARASRRRNGGSRGRARGRRRRTRSRSGTWRSRRGRRTR